MMRRIVFILAVIALVAVSSLLVLSLYAMVYASHSTATQQHQLVMYPARLMWMSGKPFKGFPAGWRWGWSWYSAMRMPSGQPMPRGSARWWFSYSVGVSGWLVEVPIWPLGLPPIGVAWFSRPRRRPQPGHCRGCGYDLRGATRRCPECGVDADRVTPATGETK